jgi:hypothetical protein
MMNLGRCRARPEVLLFLLLCSCNSQSGAMNDGGRGETILPPPAICASADANGDSTSPSFAIVQQIFVANCVDCHALGSDLDLSPAVAWGDLVDKAAPATESCGGTLVVPGDPAGSYLYEKLSNDHPCSGLRMPRTEFGSAALPECLIALVRQWILTGAPGPGSDAGAD